MNSEVEVKDIYLIFWRKRFFILIFSLLSGVASVVYSLSLPNTYEAEAKVYSVDNSVNGSQIGGSLGGLATITGLQLDSGKTRKSEIALEVLKSRKFKLEFIEKHRLLPILTASTGWDMENEHLVYDESLYDVETNSWMPNVEIPSKLDALDVLNESVTITEDRGTGVITISLKSYSPLLSKDLVEKMISDLNAEMRRRDVKEAEKSLQFLDEKLVTSSYKELRQSLFEMMEEQSKVLMLAEAREEYIFRTLDPAIVPEEKSGPSRALVCVVGTLIGALISLIIVLLNFYRGYLVNGNE